MRRRLVLTQGQLAEQIGVHWHSVQKWETGESYPKAETLQRLIALCLRHQAFTVGQELEEAQALWRHVSQDGPRRLVSFDDAWFARLLAEHSSTAVSLPAPATALAPANAPDRVLSEGLLTFLATDIEGSRVGWEHAPAAMQQALTRHHAILHQLTALYSGQVLHTAGDSFICVFADASAALQSALALQRALLAEPWPEAVAPLLIRMAVHSGAATRQGEGYVAEPTLTRLSRILALSRGGQILLTQATLDLIGARWPEGVARRDLGVHQLRDVSVPLQLWQALDPPTCHRYQAVSGAARVCFQARWPIDGGRWLTGARRSPSPRCTGGRASSKPCSAGLWMSAAGSLPSSGLAGWASPAWRLCLPTRF
ncbi:MAG TPA: helix-turn-helix domain-containing protein [Roseiflexaceae bacterium]|nr:helix-turn-helix domain-containing protein [Roseiflexaceae bacterium]